jgi:uncharacterized integral membrane protein
MAEKVSLTKKEKRGYWVKIIVFLLFGLACAASGLYTIFALPFSLPVLVYFLGMGVCGTGFCAWVVKTLVKEYRYWIKKENEE